MLNTFTYNKIYAKIKESKNVLLVCHERPDGDALGSMCAMIELLENLNERGSKKNYFAYCADAPSLNFYYLPHIEKISSDKSKFKFADFDLIIALDCGDLRRTRLIEEIKNRNTSQLVINIDHHPKIDDFADLEIKNPEAASTTELIYDFFKENRIKFNKKIANCILTGISVDTGNFLYPSTTDKTIQISSEMLSYGASFPKILERIWTNRSLAGLKVLGRAMNNLEMNKKYNLAFTVLTLEDTEGASEDDLEGISNFLGNLRGVKAVLILFEKPDGKIKGSIRSSDPKADISLLACELGGGGHAKAAGFTIEAKIEKTNGKWKIK